MSYGDDIIMSDGFVPDEDDDFDEFDAAAYESQFRKDESGKEDESGSDGQASDRQVRRLGPAARPGGYAGARRAGAPRAGMPSSTAGPPLPAPGTSGPVLWRAAQASPPRVARTWTGAPSASR